MHCYTDKENVIVSAIPPSLIRIILLHSYPRDSDTPFHFLSSREVASVKAVWPWLIIPEDLNGAD
jgi:hypothetical protein